MRARLYDVAREGRASRQEIPNVEPMARLISRLARSNDDRWLEDLLSLIEAQPELSQGLSSYVTQLLRHGRSAAALAELGILPAHGFVAELRERLIAKVLPSFVPPNDLREVFASALNAPRFRDLVAGSDPATLGRLIELLSPDDELVEARLRYEALRALDLLCHRLAAGGEDPMFHTLDPSVQDHESPFLAQAEIVTQMSGALRAVGPGERAPDAELEGTRAHALVLLNQCLDELARVRRRSPRTGATIRLTYELDRLVGITERIVALIKCTAPGAWPERGALFRALIVGGTGRAEIAPLFASASRLVAREIVSHVGRAGDHYITRTRGEWGKMWLSAAGGGVVVALLALIKSKIAASGAPPLIEALAFSLNYAFGFIVVLLLGMTIATKQPAFTAAALSSEIERSTGDDPKPLVDTIIRLVRSQIAAILGNVLIAFPVALGLGVASRELTGAAIVSEPVAAQLAADLDPIRSGALLYAALTGVWLAVAGVCAGAVSNSIVARQVVPRVRRSPPLRRWIGPGGAEWLATVVDKRAGAIAGCLVLGFLLGSTKTVGHLLGIAIDIRHVSFSTASLGLALASLEPGRVAVGVAVACLVGIGLLNLAVSFGCSFAIAWHARSPSPRGVRGLSTAVLRSLWRDGVAWLLPVGHTAKTNIDTGVDLASSTPASGATRR